MSDINTILTLQEKAEQRCKDPKPISAKEAREMLTLFSHEGRTKYAGAVDVLIARVSLDQSVRLQESNERLSRWLIALTWALVALTIALVFLGVVTIAKS